MALDFSLPRAIITVDRNNIWFDVIYRSPRNSSSRKMKMPNTAASIDGATVGALVRSVIDDQVNDVHVLFKKWTSPASGDDAFPLLPEPITLPVAIKRRVVLSIEPGGIVVTVFLLSPTAAVRRKSFANASGTVEGSGAAVETILVSGLADVLTWQEAA